MTSTDRIAELIAELRTLDNAIDLDAHDMMTELIDLRYLIIATNTQTLELDDADDDFTLEMMPMIAAFRELLAIIRERPYFRDSLTELALSLSLCPLHFLDYAICFDDDDSECAAIRTIHPSHDT